MEISGYCEEKFGEVKKAFEKNLNSGKECGASFSVTIEGKTVIDLWGGYADAAKTKPWQKDTIVNVYSTTKVATAICVLMLADKKIIDVDAPVADYWPEFAQSGKEKITVGHLLSHTAGLPGFDEALELKDLYNWEKITETLSRQKPWWDDRRRSGYHVYTFGFLLGEVVKRVSKKSLGQYLKEEITGPMDIDFHIGISDLEGPRVAELIPPKAGIKGKIMMKMMGFMMRNTLFLKAFTNPTIDDTWHEDVMSKEWQSAEIPAANGHGNARSVAKLGTILANGGELDGVRFLSQEIIEETLESRTEGKDLVINMPIKFGLGLAINSDGGLIDKFCPNPRTLYWGGYGGSLIVADLDEKMSLAYVMNKQGYKMVGDSRAKRLIKAVYSSL
ncbi:MAG: serine hydrolase domain-containing protein [Promethearchaeota archaeon]